MPSINTLSTIEQLLSSLEYELSKELKSSSEVLVFVPFAGRFRSVIPRVEVVQAVAATLQKLGHKVTVALHPDVHSSIMASLPDNINVLDITTDHYIFSKGIGERSIFSNSTEFGMVSPQTKRSPILHRIAVAECSFEAEAIIPVLAPVPSASFVLGGAITSFLSMLPTQTIGRVLLESVFGRSSSAAAEVYSLFAFKVIGVVYDLHRLLDWPGNGKPIYKDGESIILSDDAVAGDAYVAELFGWPQFAPASTRVAMDLQAGNGQLKQAEFNIREPKNTYKIKRPLTDRNMLVYPVSALARFKILFDSNLCNGCLICERSCPNGAIKIGIKMAKIEEICVHCWSCVDNCPQFALTVRRIP